MTTYRHEKMYHHKQHLKDMNQATILYELVMKVTQFVLPFSLFSFLFLHVSWLPLFLHSSMSHFSTFSSHLVSIATDKTYIFLLCNGILVFIAKYSNRTVNTNQPSSPETSPDNDSIFNEYAQSLQHSIEKTDLTDDVAVEQDEEENRPEPSQVTLEDEQEGGNGQCLIADARERIEDEDVIFDGNNNDDDKALIKEEPASGSRIEEEEEEEEINEEYEEEEEEIAKMSTEELNRKFEDFIRKMKEDLRIEAQQQLIMV